MKKRVLGIIAMILAVAMVLCSCKVGKKAVELTDDALAAEVLVDFAKGADPSVLFESDGWSNGDVFNVVWKASNVKYEDGLMTLGITEEKATAWLDDAEKEFDYTAGEARSQNYYHYGDYEVCMKPSANPGTASTFFTCTGPYDTKFVLDENGEYKLDENGQRITVQNPHDEIDIEFLGKDTTKVQFNFFVNGQGGNEYMYDLGFDASKEFHRYGFRWEPDAITWFVDGKPVYKVTTDKSVSAAENVRIVDVLPSTPGRVLTNYWCGNARAVGWMGTYKGAVNDNGTQYKWIATNAVGAPLNPEEKPNTEITEIDWNAIAPVNPTFESTEVYTVVNDGTTSNVTYSSVGGSSYINVEMDITEVSAGKNYLHLNVTNNGADTANVRVNVVDSELVAQGAQNMSTNLTATMDGVAVYTDAVWGGSFFDIPAGKTSELVIQFNGAVEKLQLMLDSSRNDAGTYAGDITVDAIKFATVGEVVIPDPGTDTPVEPAPDAPVSGDLSVIINGAEVTFGGNTGDGYGVNADDAANTLTVTYNNIIGNSYKNIWADVSSIAADKNIFTMTVTNPGAEAVKVRIDVESRTQVNSNTTCCNLSATQDGVEAFTDLEWGGSSFVIEAGATAVLEVTYDASKLPTNVKIFVDSHQWDDSTAHAGSVVISAMEFKGEHDVSTNPVIPDEPATPDQPEAPSTGTELTFNVDEGFGYTVTAGENGAVNVKYNGVGNTYKPITAEVAGIANGNDTLTVYVTNNGSADSRVRFDVQGSTWVSTGDGGSGTDACNVSATGGDIWTDLTWGGSALTVPAGQTVKVVITYDANGVHGAAVNLLVFVDTARGDANTYNSDITLSGIAFTGGSAPEEPTVNPDPTPDTPAQPETPDEPETPEQPVTPDTPTEPETPEQPAGEAVANLEFWLSDAALYAVTNNGDGTYRITYSGNGSTYACAGAPVAELANGKDTLTLTVTNNGTADSRVRFDVQATVQVGNTSTCNVSATGGDIWTDSDWGGSTLTVPAGQSIAVTITYDSNSQRGAVTNLVVFADSARGDANSYNTDITLSNIVFSGGSNTETPADPDTPSDPETPTEPETPAEPETPVDLTTKINGTEVRFDGNVTDGYTVVMDDEANTMTVSYTGMIGNCYKNLWTDISGIAADKNTFSMKVTNNGAKAVRVRIDIESQTQMTANTTCCNKTSKQDGVLTTTDLEWGGSTFVVEPGTTSVLEVFYTETKLPTNLKIFLDSHQWDDPTTHGGSIVISEMQFKTSKSPAMVEFPLYPTYPSIPSQPGGDSSGGNSDSTETPTSGNLTTTINGATVTFDGNTADGYGVNAESDSLSIVYTNIKGNSYKNIWTNVASIASDKDTFTMTVTNNGTKAVAVRVDIESQTQINANHVCCNLSATQGGVEAYTDLEWGGSHFEIAPGATSVLVVKYDPSKLPTNLKIFVDSKQHDDDSYHAGDITVSGMAFSGEYAPEGGGSGSDEGGNEGGSGEGSGTPETPTSGNLTTTINGTQVTFDGNTADGYGVNAENGTLNVVYTNIVGNSYKNIWANVASIASDKDTFTMKVTNNGTQPVAIRIDIESQTPSTNHICCNLSATQDDSGASTDPEWGGSHFEIAPGATSVLVVKYDPSKLPTNLKIFMDSKQHGDESSHAGNITISEMAFSGEYVPEGGGSGSGSGSEGSDSGNDPATEIDWSSISPVAPNFGGTDKYTVTNTASNVTYTNVGGSEYCNVEMDIASSSAGKNYVHLTVTNNGSETVKFRVNVLDSEYACVNLSATMDGNTVYTDLEWGGSFFDIAAGQTAELVIKYTGTANYLQLMPDSSHNDSTIRSGNLTVDNIKFATSEGPEIDWSSIPAIAPTFNSTVKYTVTNTASNVTYTSVGGSEYCNVEMDIASSSAGKNYVHLTVTNNGSETVKFRVNVLDSEYACVNLSATMDGNTVYTDLEWGGSFFDIAAGQTAELVIKYTGTANYLQLMPDSSHNDSTIRSGNLTVGNIKFAS